MFLPRQDNVHGRAPYQLHSLYFKFQHSTGYSGVHRETGRKQLPSVQPTSLARVPSTALGEGWGLARRVLHGRHATPQGAKHPATSRQQGSNPSVLAETWGRPDTLAEEALGHICKRSLGRKTNWHPQPNTKPRESLLSSFQSLAGCEAHTGARKDTYWDRE